MARGNLALAESIWKEAVKRYQVGSQLILPNQHCLQVALIPADVTQAEMNMSRGW